MNLQINLFPMRRPAIDFAQWPVIPPAAMGAAAVQINTAGQVELKLKAL